MTSFDATALERDREGLAVLRAVIGPIPRQAPSWRPGSARTGQARPVREDAEPVRRRERGPSNAPSAPKA